MEEISNILAVALRASYDGEYDKAIRMLIEALRKQNVKIINLQKEMEELRNK